MLKVETIDIELSFFMLFRHIVSLCFSFNTLDYDGATYIGRVGYKFIPKKTWV